MAKKIVTLSHTDFPLYSVRFIGDRHFLVAGGGGQAKTGISNAIEIFELKNDDGACISNKVKHFDAGDKCIMHGTSLAQGKNHVFAAGMEGSCQIYSLKYRVQALKEDGQETVGADGIRKRKSNLTKSSARDTAAKVVTFDVEPEGCVETDFHADGGYQKVVRFGPDQSLMVTAGADGHFRVWQFPSLKKLYEVKAHSNEIDDLDISPIGNTFVTLSRDSKAYVWETKDGKKKCELKYDLGNKDVKYRFRNCRYVTVKDKKTVYLFTTHIPVTRGTKPLPCYITKWDTSKYVPAKSVETGTEVLSSFAVSGDGVYLGVGTISGSVSVYIAFSLQRLYHVAQVHNIFVTGLEFAPDSETSRQLMGGSEFSLLSISADNQVKLHQNIRGGQWSLLWAIVGCIVFVYLFFYLISYFGL